MLFTKEKLEELRTRKVSAVFDSSPLIYLTRIGILNDVLRCYTERYIPEGVRVGVIDRGMALQKSDAHILNEYIKTGQIKVKKTENPELMAILSRNLCVHEADVEAVCLAEELQSILVMDDPRAIEVAKLRGINVEPTLTTILTCYALDYIDFKKAEHSYRVLLRTHFRVKANVYDRALELLRMVKNRKG